MTSELAALQDLLTVLEADCSLDEPERFRERIDALDRLDAFPLREPFPPLDSALAEAQLYRRARALQARMEAANRRFYDVLRGEIRLGAGGRLLQVVRHASRVTSGSEVAPGESYDHLDDLVSGVLHFSQPEPPIRSLAAEMVAYQPTPARHIFDLLERAPCTEQDVLVDLGCGLGHVPLLAAICKGTRSVGIEREPAYVCCARQSAAELNLPNVTFFEQDARNADISAGTLFYLYTPFRGAMLRAVLDALRSAAARRAIRVCTFGPCMSVVAAEAWLEPLAPSEPGRVGVFRSKN